MNNKEKTEIDYEKINRYANYIYNIVDKTDFSSRTAYGKSVSRIFSVDENGNVPEAKKKRRYLLKSFLVYVLTILYSESENKISVDKDEEEFLEKNKILEDDDEYVKYGANGKITVRYDVDSLADKILTLDESTLKILSDLDFNSCSGYLALLIGEITDMAKSICKLDDTMVDIVDARVGDGEVEFTIDSYSDSSAPQDMDKHIETIDTAKSKFGELVLDSLSKYARENGIIVIIGLDSITDIRDNVRKSVRVAAGDRDIIEDDGSEYSIELFVIPSDDTDPLNSADFSEFMEEHDINVATPIDSRKCDNVKIIGDDGKTIEGIGEGIEYNLLFRRKETSYDTNETDTGELFDPDNPIQDATKNKVNVVKSGYC